MSGAPLDSQNRYSLSQSAFQNQRIIAPQQQRNHHEIQNQKVAQGRGNPQHQQSHQQQKNIQQRITGEYMQPPPIQQNPQTIVNQQQLSPEQISRLQQVNQMTQKSLGRHLGQISQMNQQIFNHRMSNMNSFENGPPAPDFAGHQTSASQHMTFPQQVPSDHANMGGTLINQTNQMSSMDTSGMGYASLDAISTMPNSMPSSNHSEQQLLNVRNCRCRSDQRYCAACQICGHPGHVRTYPGRAPTQANGHVPTGRWCDPHYEREKREIMKRNPDAFQSFEAPHYPDLGSASGQSTSEQRMQQARAMRPERPYQQMGGAEHHGDRRVTGGIAAATRSSPYQLDQENAHNFKGNNSFMLNRTTVNRNLFEKKSPIDFAGYNAQGEKVQSQEYYQSTPGRQNEFDYYREYKKQNNSDFMPCNEDQINNNYRPFQSGIPPKRTMKLNKNVLQQQNQ